MRKVLILWSAILALFLPVVGCSGEGSESRSIMVFAGVASKPPLEEAGRAFEGKIGIKVYFNFGGSGAMLSQMKLTKTGDLYIPASSDFMIKAEKDGVVTLGSDKIVAYLVPGIAVQKGNPQNIQSLADLARPGIKMAIANPESATIGLYAVEILEHNRLLDDVQAAGTCVAYAESADKLAGLVVLKTVDAVIGWTVFASWNAATIDIVYLKPNEMPRLSYIPGGVSTFAQDSESAQKFLDFLTSSESREIFRKNGYIVTESVARKFAPGAKIGGEYQLPVGFTTLVK